MTKIELIYDIDRDVENWLKATKAVNNPNPTRMHMRFTEEMGNTFTKEKIKAFIEARKEEWGGINDKLQAIEDEWLRISDRYFRKCKGIFGTVLPQNVIHVFLTTDNRATYSLQDGYFFLSVHAKSPNLTIMHELFHFYTWEIFHEEVESGRIDPLCYNNIKESLTVLLNEEFADLLAGAFDKGYPQHQEMRANILKNWRKTKEIRQVFDSAKSLC